MSRFLKKAPQQPAQEPKAQTTTIVAEPEVLRFHQYGKTDVTELFSSIEENFSLIQQDKPLTAHLKQMLQIGGYKGQFDLKKINQVLNDFLNNGRKSKNSAKDMDSAAMRLLVRMKDINSGKVAPTPVDAKPATQPVLDPSHRDENGILFGVYAGIVQEVKNDRMILSCPGILGDEELQCEIMLYHVPQKGGKVIHEHVNMQRPKGHDKVNPADFVVGNKVHFIYSPSGVCHTPTISGKHTSIHSSTSKSDTMGFMKKATAADQTNSNSAPATATEEKAPAKQEAPKQETKPQGMSKFGVKKQTPPPPPAKSPEEIANDHLAELAANLDMTPQIISADDLLEGLMAQEGDHANSEGLLTAYYADEDQKESSLAGQKVGIIAYAEVPATGATFKMKVPNGVKPGQEIEITVPENVTVSVFIAGQVE